MIDGVKTKFTKRGSFWFISTITSIMVFAVFVYSSIMYSDAFIAAVIIAIVIYIMAWLYLSSTLMEKTAAKIKNISFNADWWCTDGDSYLMIDTKIGQIAAVWASNPFKIQGIDASLITGAKVTLGKELKNRKTTNKIGVKYTIGDKQYCCYIYRMSKSYVVLASDEGQDYLNKANKTCEMLLNARDAALQNMQDLEYSIALGRYLTYDEVSQVNILLNGNRKIEAIKFIREATKSGLAEAKKIVDDWYILYYRISKIYSTLYSSYTET
ncbi:MAG TPA: hypothetical protein VJX95_02655 [Oscillospiraceae bacterium]|nr:hypothetical protein [Oscillospiraceae bacterium]